MTVDLKLSDKEAVLLHNALVCFQNHLDEIFEVKADRLPEKSTGFDKQDAYLIRHLGRRDVIAELIKLQIKDSGVDLMQADN